jgi:hypothetical protein
MVRIHTPLAAGPAPKALRIPAELKRQRMGTSKAHSNKMQQHHATPPLTARIDCNGVFWREVGRGLTMPTKTMVLI